MLSQNSEKKEEFREELADLIWEKLATILSAVLNDDLEAWKGVLHKAKQWRPVDRLPFDKMIGLVQGLRSMQIEDIPDSLLDSIAHSILDVVFVLLRNQSSLK